MTNDDKNLRSLPENWQLDAKIAIYKVFIDLAKDPNMPEIWRFNTGLRGIRPLLEANAIKELRTLLKENELPQKLNDLITHCLKGKTVESFLTLDKKRMARRLKKPISPRTALLFNRVA